MTNILSRALLFALALCAALPLQAEVRIPNLLSSHMVLQREKPLEIWGWADPGERVQVAFEGQLLKTKADAQGAWSVTLKAMPHGGPYTLVISGQKNTITLEDILLGDVWVCSGQSNMQWKLIDSDNGAAEIAAANHPGIRLFTVPPVARGVEVQDVEGTWKVCTPETVPGFSGVGYFFGRELNTQTGIPIGLINSSWGGTRVEAWMAPATFRAQSPEARDYYASTGRDIPFPSPQIDRQYQEQTQAVARFRNDLDNGEDKGQTEKWYAENYDRSTWTTIDFPQRWRDIPGVDGVNGHLYLAFTLELPAGVAAQPARIFLSKVDDQNIVWINGIKVGEGRGHRTEQAYTLPYGVLKEGKNQIVIRNTNHAGNGGINPTEPIYIESAGIKYSLQGEWLSRLSLTSADYYGTLLNPNTYPSLLYLGMINPLLNYKIKGAIWYQGESNVSQPIAYQSLFPAMITNWREAWGDEFPFYWVQIANFVDAGTVPRPEARPMLREAQTMALALPKTGEALTIDIGTPRDIHPTNKQEVGRRLALIALNKDYGQSNLIYTGPTFKEMQLKGNQAILTFDNIASGLVAQDPYGYLRGFQIAGPDQKFTPAQAKIQGNQVIVSNEKIQNPVAVRYNFEDTPDGNLYNSANLPATPFRTDNYPERVLQKP